MTIAVLALGEGHEVLERAGARERELHLVADHRSTEGGIRLSPPVEGVVRDAHGADAALVEQGGHAAHRDAVAHERVGLVHLVERDPGQPEAGGARVRTASDDRWEGCDREELGRHHDVLTVVAERLREDALAAAERIHLRGVEEGHTQLERPADDVVGRALRVVVAVAPLARAELPRAEADPADESDPGHLEISHVLTMPAPAPARSPARSGRIVGAGRGERHPARAAHQASSLSRAASLPMSPSSRRTDNR